MKFIYAKGKTSENRTNMSSPYLQEMVSEHKTWPPFLPFAAAVVTCPASKYSKMKTNEC